MGWLSLSIEDTSESLDCDRFLDELRLFRHNLTQLGVADLITCDKFFGDRLGGVDFVRARKFPFPIDKASRR